MPLTDKENEDPLKDADVYLRDSGVAFDQHDDRVYEHARRGRSRRRGYVSPPSNALPPVPLESPTQQQTPRSPPADRSHAELFAALQKQQRALVRLRTENEEHVRNQERLGADLLAMTHRYLQAQSSIDALEKRCKDAEERAERLAFQLEEKAMAANLRRTPESLSPSRSWHAEQTGLRVMSERRNDDRGDTATVSAGTVDSSEYVEVDLSALSIRPDVPPEDLLKLVRSINIQSSEVARACIASAAFRPGVRTIQVDNKMIVDLNEAIGCILVQILRSRDHSKNKAIVELGIRALLSNHVAKLIEDWPFHAKTKRRSRESGKDSSEQPSSIEKEEFSEAVENILGDIATILSLSGSPGQSSSLIRSHRDRIASTLDALLKTAEGLANQIKGGRFGGPLPTEYSFIYARPGAAFNKDLMQKHGTQQSMILWKSTPKKPVQVLCTREVGLARLYRSPSGSSSMSILSSQTGSGGPGSYLKEIEVLSKVVVVFESDLDK